MNEKMLTYARTWGPRALNVWRMLMCEFYIFHLLNQARCLFLLFTQCFSGIKLHIGEHKMYIMFKFCPSMSLVLKQIHMVKQALQQNCLYFLWLFSILFLFNCVLFHIVFFLSCSTVLTTYLQCSQAIKHPLFPLF